MEENLHCLRKGTRLIGRYTIEGVLGQGGFGITYLGIDELHEKKVAIKEFFPQGIVTRNIEYQDTVTVTYVEEKADYEKGKVGIFDVVYSVTDSDNLTTKFTRKVAITEEETYISDLKWKSATIGSGAIGIDKSVRQQPIKLLNENGTYEKFKKGIYNEIWF